MKNPVFLASPLVPPLFASWERLYRESGAENFLERAPVLAARPAQSRTFETCARTRTAPLGPETLDIVLSSGRRPNVRGVSKPPERICAQIFRVADLGRRCNSSASIELCLSGCFEAFNAFPVSLGEAERFR
jgi:hypothetical protein